VTTNDSPLRRLASLGQSVWLDDLQRSMLEDGTLARLIADDGLSGLTSNPAILSKALTSGTEYAADIARLLAGSATGIAIYETLALEDVQRAADLFRDVYDRSVGRDGYVSMEVSPHLADDTAATVAEARRLWGLLARPNVMIKVPGTRAGLPAIRALTAAGINVNVTLLFSPERCRQAEGEYLAGLEDRLAADLAIDRIASVASFFVSRIDTLIDRRLDALSAGGEAGAHALRGRGAVACAARAFELHGESMNSGRWQALAAHGAHPQRLLWASTSTKDPSYPPTKYVDELIAPGTINTMPLATIDAYRRQGQPVLTLERHLAAASDTRKALEALGIDLEQVAGELERDGVRKFVEPFESLQRWLEERRAQHRL